MTASSKLYNNLLLLLFTAWLTYCSCLVASSKFNNSSILCVETDRDALLHFKQGSIDNCAILDDWGHTLDCCQWQGIYCNNQSGHVTGLLLPGSFDCCLEGTLSVSLLKLKHLKYLDLSYNNFTEALPKFIGSLASLEILDLSNAGFTGVIPQEIGNLSRLTALGLNNENSFDHFNLRAESLGWLSRLRLIREIDLSYVDLSATANTWLSIVNNLPFLRELHLDNCRLSLNSPPSLSYVNSSTTLGILSLVYNNLNDTSIFEWLLNLNGLETSLTYLDLSGNDQMFGNNLQLSKSSMKRLDNLCSLQTLGLTDTNLNYKFSEIIQSFSTCPQKELVSLELSENNVWGSISDNIGAFSLLSVLELNYNQLNGTISQSLGKLTMLEGLDLSGNSLNGTLTKAHLSNLSKLRYLILYPNTKNIVVNISADWIPPFQLDQLILNSCKIGPHFPR
ncbi:receptor-like protein EIX1 [Silene latifolia]|uniref:receptor-like protein EIX1 n=1 Tax=Silene latifolia TaxID=37657 RepID=UPI003D7807FB